MGTIPKKSYRLWWEYLKLSDSYREYCFGSPQERKKIKAKEIKDHNKLYMQNRSIVDVFKSRDFKKNITETYRTFGNVHTDSFEDFWEDKGKHMPISVFTDECVRDFSEVFKDLIEFYDQDQDKGKQSLKDFQDYVLKKLDHRITIYLEINLFNPIGKIKKEVYERIERGVKSEHVSGWKEISNWFFRRNNLPTYNFRYDEVKRYLKVVQAFRLYKLKGEAAFKKVFPNGDFSDQSQHRAFYKDREKGEKIIENVETGFFPGYYN